LDVGTEGAIGREIMLQGRQNFTLALVVRDIFYSEINGFVSKADFT